MAGVTAQLDRADTENNSPPPAPQGGQKPPRKRGKFALFRPRLPRLRRRKPQNLPTDMSMSVQAATAPDGGFDGGRPMTIIEHLQELRTRLIVCCVAIVLGLVVSSIFTNDFLKFLVNYAKEAAPNIEVIQLRVLDNFLTFFKVSLYGALALAMPVLVYEVLMYILPGLTPKEKRWVIPLVLGIVACFALGVTFAWYVVLPKALEFLLNFNADIAANKIQLTDYISFVLRLVFWVGVSFQTPMVILALAAFGLVDARRLIGWWRYVIVLVFVIAAVITPTPDPVTQTLVAGPMIGLYIIGIILAHFFGRKRPH